jgi:CHAT domain-containing protein
VPEARRQALVRTFGDRWQVPFSFAQQGDAGAALALFTRLNRQGLLQDIRRNQVLLARSGPQRPLFEQLTAITNQLARPNLPLEQEKALLARKEQLEQELYRLLPQVKPRLVDPMQVARRLPADAVLVEFQRYRSINVGSGLYGPPRYLALVLTPKGAMHAVLLGEASELEPSIQKALGRVAGIPERSGVSSEQAQQALAEVRRRLLDPLLPHVGAAKRWIVSPDGEIHRVPLAALPASDGDPNGATLGETRQLRVITTGRDLLEDAPTPASPSAALVMADPDYDARLGPSSPGATPPNTVPQTRSGDDLAKSWGPLPKFKEEGEAVAALLGSGLISGVQATTTRLQRAQGPRIVHIATHGFFLPDRKEDLDAKGPFQGFTTLEMSLLAREDPQLRSGIVLAGANHPDTNPNDDGRLTALEATALNLSGTALVTLSACSTGLGSQATGEGVYGLQRALRVAGARATLLSLWEVDDAATKEFMVNYYTLLKQGEGRAEALREVQQRFRNRTIKSKLPADDWSHPHYWAAWQLSGDGNPLAKGVRSPR